jgi:hypothetical protein
LLWRESVTSVAAFRHRVAIGASEWDDVLCFFAVLLERGVAVNR